MVFSGRFFGRCLTSGHLESLGQLWFAGFNSGAGGYDPGHDPVAAPRREAAVGRRPTAVRKHATSSRHAASIGSAPIAVGPGHPMRSRGRSITCSIQGAGEALRPRRLIALRQMPQDPRARASDLRRRLIYRERLAPTGNRAIPSGRIRPVVLVFFGYPTSSRALSTACRHPGFQAGPIWSMLHAICGVVKNN